MEKTINIGDTPVTLNNNIGWAFAYRDQFGRDIIPSVMPLLASMIDVIGGLVGELGKTDEITPADIAALAGTEAMAEAYAHLSVLELTDAINITWAMAKCADDSIPEPGRWVRQFESFPLDEVLPAVITLLVRGVVSTKNQKRLQDMARSLQPLISTSSSSPDSNED